GRSGQCVALRIVRLELLARADGAVVPVVHPVAIEVGLADLGPEFARVGTGIGVLPQTLTDRVSIRRVPALAPRRIDGAQGGVDRMAELVDANALGVVTV